MRHRMHLVITSVLVVLALVIALQNLEHVTVDFLTVSATLPLALLVVIVYALGVATGGSVLALLRRRLRRRAD